jgi:hypothetical protein
MTPEKKKRRLPKVLSIAFGSSLVSLAMAMTGGTANAWDSCLEQWTNCQRCYYTNTGIAYCYDSGGPGQQCCASGGDWDDEGTYCGAYGGWCS